VKLARRGEIHRVEIDTDHFKGNAPGTCMLEWSDAGGDFDPEKETWGSLVANSPLQPHSRHVFDVTNPHAATHVRLNIYPDGGVARLRLIGRASAE
jgi:allantoicase